MNTPITINSVLCSIQKCLELSGNICDRSLPRETKQKRVEFLLGILNGLSYQNFNLNEVEVLKKTLNNLLSVLNQRHGNSEFKKIISEACVNCAILIPEHYKWVLNNIFTKFKNKSIDDKPLHIKMAHDITKEVYVNNRYFGSGEFSLAMEFILYCLGENIAESALLPLLDFGYLIAICKPEFFNSSFEEFIDYVIGWMVESTSSSLIVKCFEILVQLKSFWARNAEYGKALMRNLVDDLICCDLGSKNVKGSDDSPDRGANSARTIVLALSGVIQIFVEMGEPSSTAVVEVIYQVMETFKTKRADLEGNNETDSAAFLCSFAEVFTGFSRIHPLTEELEAIVFDLVENMLSLIPDYMNHLPSLICLLQNLAKLQLIPTLPSRITISIIERFLGENGIFEQIQHFDSLMVCQAASAAVAASFSPTSLPNVQMAYANARRLIRESIAELKMFSENVYKPLSRVRFLEARLITIINSFSKIAVSKNNLIVMMGMMPCLLEVLLDDVPISEQWVVENHPTLVTAVLKMVYQHVSSHDYFVAGSQWVKIATTSSVITESTSKAYLEYQMEKITSLLSLEIKWKIINNIIIEWITGMFELIAEQTLQTWYYIHPVLPKMHFLLRKKAVESNFNEMLHRILERFEPLDTLSESDAVTTTVQIVQMMRSLDVNEGAKMWGRLDTTLLVRCGLNSQGWDSREMQQVRLTSASIGAEDFVFLTDFLLKRTMFTYQRNPQGDDNWISDSIKQLFGKTVADCKNPTLAGNSFNEKWRWVLAQLAFFCVENKMKTPLGKPADSFQHFRAEITRLAKEALTSDEKIVENGENNMKKINKDDEEDDDYGSTRPLNSSEEWFRVRCLLEFIEVLDKVMFVAHKGSLYPIANMSQQARQFFTMNTGSCQEWLNRIYSPAMVIAFHNGYFAQTIRFGSSALNDFEKKQKKAEQEVEDKNQENKVVPSMVYVVLGWMARAMAELSSEQAARGLKDWARQVYNVEMNWLDGIADMAAGQYETALARLSYSLTNEILPDSTKVLIRHIILDVLKILRLPSLLDPASCPPSLSIWSEADRLGNTVPDGFEATAFDKVKKLCSFTILDKVGQVPVPWDVTKIIEHKELTLMQTLRRVDVQDLRKEMAKTGHLILTHDTGLRLSADLASLDRIFSAVLCKMSRSSQKAIVNEISPKILFHARALPDLGARFAHCMKTIFWADRLTGLSVSPELYNEAARLARKSGNYLSSDHLLQKCLSSVKLGDVVLFKSTLQRAKLTLSTAGPEQKTVELVKVLTAMVKEVQMQRYRLNNSLMTHNLNIDKSANEICLDEAIASCCLLLAKWLEEDPAGSSITQDSNFFPFWAELDLPRRYPVVGTENIIYGFLTLATMKAPRMAKAHLRLADWIYSFATSPVTSKGVFEVKHKMYLGYDVPQATLDSLWNACNNSKSFSQLEKAAENILGSNEIDILMATASPYVYFYDTRRERLTMLLHTAMQEYFAFIANSCYEDHKSIGTVSATLRILGSLVKHFDFLQSTIDDGLSTTNAFLWKDILPQLFSRLSHPSENVRKSIVSLILKIACSSPHSVIFQIVSGTSSTMVVEESDDAIGAEKDEDDTGNKDRSLMYDCCKQLESDLELQYPVMVQDTKEFIAELQKINLLYEERWVFVLSNLEHEMEKRLEQIRAESQRTMQAAHLDDKSKTDIVAEKTRLITTSVYRILWDLYERTCLQEPNTPNEKAFVDGYGEQLKNAFESSKANWKSPEKAWAPFKQILILLQQKNARRGGHLASLQITNISSYLANLSPSCQVPIPGQENKPFDEIVYVSKIRPTVSVLPTKTRPKKMTFLANDGKEHTFLFKGQEDLHLDERIMQLLNICNLMLRSSTKRSWPAYNARHYAVTPLGTRSGLIQWVVGATPMFHLYRKWQTRQAQLKADSKTGAAKSVELERPTDLFLKTLRRTFANHNVPVAADRSKWPQDILKEVLISLIKETPRDILSRELWLKSGGSDTWWRVVSRLARSTAVMSMIGAILGLGDRHLDNLLVNLDTGDVVHIDYNICFDKGRNLRVPETVPFRMTQNMVASMGPTQLEGTFRLSCAHVLCTLREQREILLTILDAFVYDPLVDWAAADHLTSTSAAVGVAVTLAVYGTDLRAVGAKPVAREMFSVRIKELSVPWTNNCNELTFALNSVRNILKKQMTSSKHNAWNAPEIIEQERVEAGRRLKSAITQHHQMMKDVRPLLKALATCDDRFANYLKLYRAVFSEPLVKGHQLLEPQPNDLPACITLFETVLENIDEVYSQLISLNNKENNITSTISPTAMEILNSSLRPPPGLEAFTPLTREQEQNAHARSIVKRVQSRLEGHVEGSSSKTPLLYAEQADYWIQQATRKSLLALMYEGWTAWV